jgi:hypothetical protein
MVSGTLPFKEVSMDLAKCCVNAVRVEGRSLRSFLNPLLASKRTFHLASADRTRNRVVKLP